MGNYHIIIAALVVLVSFLLAGCPRDLDNKGDKYIATIYQAEVTGSMGPYDNNTKVYEISVRNSPIVDTLTPKLTASNIAWLAYEGLSDSYRQEAAGVIVNLRTTKGQTATYSYNAEILQKVSQKGILYRKYSDMLLSGDFETVKKYRDPNKNPPSYREEWPRKIAELESAYGKLKGYVPFGIREIKDSHGHEFQFFGYLQFENGTYPYKIDFEIENDQEQWANFLIRANLR